MGVLTAFCLFQRGFDQAEVIERLAEIFVGAVVIDELLLTSLWWTLNRATLTNSWNICHRLTVTLLVNIVKRWIFCMIRLLHRWNAHIWNWSPIVSINLSLDYSSSCRSNLFLYLLLSNQPRQKVWIHLAHKVCIIYFWSSRVDGWEEVFFALAV